MENQHLEPVLQERVGHYDQEAQHGSDCHPVAEDWGFEADEYGHVVCCQDATMNWKVNNNRVREYIDTHYKLLMHVFGDKHKNTYTTRITYLSSS